MPVRSRIAPSRLGSAEGSPYQSPPPSYLRRVMVSVSPDCAARLAAPGPSWASASRSAAARARIIGALFSFLLEGLHDLVREVARQPEPARELAGRMAGTQPLVH